MTRSLSRATVRPLGREDDEQRLADVGEGFAAHRHGRFVVAERREQEVRADGPGDRARRPVQLGRKVQRVRRVDAVEVVRTNGFRVVGEALASLDDVVADEPHAVRNGERSNVDGAHVGAGGREGRRHPRTAPYANFEEAVVFRQSSDERAVNGCHGGKLMRRPAITTSMLVDIVPIGEVPAHVKREASTALRSVFECDVTVHADQDIPEGAFDRSRSQYRAEQFIELASRIGAGEKNIGITAKDLYYRRRNYVFGLAYLNGNGSVISTYRLQTSSDGGISTKPSTEVFSDRVRKEVVHEIGHTIGLEHCDNNKCVMSFSPTVREVDVKEENLCGTCSRLVR